MKRVIGLLTAAIIVLGMAMPTYAATELKTTEKAYLDQYAVYGNYPVVTGQDALNTKISQFVWKTITTLQTDSVSFNPNRTKVSYTIEDNGDYSVVTVTVSALYSAMKTSVYESKYYIDRKAGKEVTETVYNDYVKSKEAPAKPAVKPSVQPDPQKIANDIMAQIKAMPVVTNSSNQVSLKGYADMMGYTVGYNYDLGVVEIISGTAKVPVKVNESVFVNSLNARLDLPLVVTGDDILIDASLVYAVLKASVVVNSDGSVEIVGK